MQKAAFLRSSIGAKILMAITGLGLVGFVIAHMLGNLLIFFGRDALNSYGESLRNLPGGLLWVARAGLVVMVVVHIITAIKVSAANRAARPIPYQRKKNLVTGYGARTMIWSGIIIASFLAYHLAHYTFLVTNPEFQNMVDGNRHDVYTMVVTGFQSIPIVVLYIVAVGLLSLHLGHGIPSFFQSLGLRHPTYTPIIRRAGKAITIILFVGYASIPIAVVCGWVGAL